MMPQGPYNKRSGAFMQSDVDSVIDFAAKKAVMFYDPSDFYELLASEVALALMESRSMKQENEL